MGLYCALCASARSGRKDSRYNMLLTAFLLAWQIVKRRVLSPSPRQVFQNRIQLLPCIFPTAHMALQTVQETVLRRMSAMSWSLSVMRLDIRQKGGIYHLCFVRILQSQLIENLKLPGREAAHPVQTGHPGSQPAFIRTLRQLSLVHGSLTVA